MVLKYAENWGYWFDFALDLLNNDTMCWKWAHCQGSLNPRGQVYPAAVELPCRSPSHWGYQPWNWLKASWGCSLWMLPQWDNTRVVHGSPIGTENLSNPHVLSFSSITGTTVQGGCSSCPQEPLWFSGNALLLVWLWQYFLLLNLPTSNWPCWDVNGETQSSFSSLSIWDNVFPYSEFM